jgi:hypothetical protein
MMFVACKMPHGLRIGRITLNKPLTQLPGTPAVEPPYPMYSGFAITGNVPEADWDDWYSANKDGDMVRNNLIFASSDIAIVRQWCAAHRNAQTGLGSATGRSAW